MALLGLDIGGSFIKIGVIENDAIVHRGVVNVARATYDNLLKQVRDLSGPLMKKFTIEALGVGVPGAVKFPAGLVTQSPHLGVLEGHDFKRDLEAVWDCPVIVANDVNLAAYGEFRKNPEVQNKRARVMVYLAIGTGLGGGIILDSSIFWGSSGYAGELGHISIQQEGPQCACGSFGCLEVFVSATGILRMVQEVIWKYPKSSLRRFKLENLKAEDVFEASRFGDEAARDVIERSSTALGVGLGSLINAFNPDAIVVGGGVMGSNDFYLQRASQLARRYAFKAPYRQCLIVPSHLRYFAGVWGAALFAERWARDRASLVPHTG